MNGSFSAAQDVYSQPQRPLSSQKRVKYASKYGRTSSAFRDSDTQNRNNTNGVSNFRSGRAGEPGSEYLGMKINSLSSSRTSLSSGKQNGSPSQKRASAGRRTGGNPDDWRKFSIDDQLEALEDLLRLERQRLVRNNSVTVHSNSPDAYYNGDAGSSPSRDQPRPPNGTSQRGGSKSGSPLRRKTKAASGGSEFPSVNDNQQRNRSRVRSGKMNGRNLSQRFETDESEDSDIREGYSAVTAAVSRARASNSRARNRQASAKTMKGQRTGTPADWESTDYDDEDTQENDTTFDDAPLDDVDIDDDSYGDIADLSDSYDDTTSYNDSDQQLYQTADQRLRAMQQRGAHASRNGSAGAQGKLARHSTGTAKTTKQTRATTRGSTAGVSRSSKKDTNGKRPVSRVASRKGAGTGRPKSSAQRPPLGRPQSSSSTIDRASSSNLKVPPLTKPKPKSAGPRIVDFKNVNDMTEAEASESPAKKKGKMPVMYARLSVNVNVIKNMFKAAGYRITRQRDDWHCWWGKHWKMEQFRTLQAYQKVNHFPGTFALGRKDRLHKNLSRMKRHYGASAYDFFPQSWIIPMEGEDLRREFRIHGGMFIAKPCASARGIGIKVITDISQVPRKKSYLIQRYLSDPYLIDGFKFDLRLYVLVTSFDPLRIYLFEDGLVRFCTERYRKNPKNSSNKFMHLTNYSLQKNREGFVENQDADADDIGNKWSIKALKRYFRENGIDDTELWERVNDLIIKTVISVEDAINTAMNMYVKHRGTCYELFGFDVLLDKNLKPWIVEVNVSPSLHSSSPLDKKIKSNMVTDMFNLLRFQMFDKDAYERKQRQERQDRLRGLDRAGSASSGSRTARRRPVTQVDWDTFRNLGDQDFDVLVESAEEFERKGRFSRIFPTKETSKYDRFFPYQRYYNNLLHSFVMRGGTTETLSRREPPRPESGAGRRPGSSASKSRPGSRATSRGGFL